MNEVRRRSGPLPRPEPPPFVSSGKFTPVLIALLCVALLAVAWERGRGNFHRLTTAVLDGKRPADRPTGPGGEEAIRLVRHPSSTSAGPELLSATLLPGRGLNILQITAQVPGHGEIPVLMAPTLDRADAMLTGSGPDANGALSSTMGGAFLIPWAGRLSGKSSATPGVLQTLWLGQRLTFPAFAPSSFQSTRGLLLDRSADATHTNVILDGDSVDATFHPGTFSGNWPSTGSVHIQVDISGHTMNLTATVQNTGSTPMPVGVGWLPYFNLPSQDRANASLVLPSTTRLEVDHSTGLPTGRMLPVAGTALDFAGPHGNRIGAAALDETFVHLTPGVLDNNPVAELRDNTFGYGVRITPMSANIKGLHVIAPADQTWVAISPETNFDDALGPQWETSEGSGIRTLQPGEALQWKVRIEVFTFTASPHAPAR